MQEVGYCQGTNQIVAILLIFLTEEDVFWALAQLMTYGKHTMQVRGWMGRWTGLELRRASLQGCCSRGVSCQGPPPPCPDLHVPTAL